MPTRPKQNKTGTNGTEIRHPYHSANEAGENSLERMFEDINSVKKHR